MNYNEVTDKGLRKLLHAIETKENAFTEFRFVENAMTDDGAFYLYNWLKKIRAMNVPHS